MENFDNQPNFQEFSFPLIQTNAQKKTVKKLIIGNFIWKRKDLVWKLLKPWYNALLNSSLRLYWQIKVKFRKKIQDINGTQNNFCTITNWIENCRLLVFYWNSSSKFCEEILHSLMIECLVAVTCILLTEIKWMHQ